MTADLVVLELRARSAPFFRFNTEDLPARVRVSLTAPSTQDSLDLPKGLIELHTIRSVWYRRPVAPRPLGVEDAGAHAFAIAEGLATLEDLWARIDARWVSPIAAIRSATPRLAQLRLAHELGLSVLPTLITNDPERAKAFIQSHPSVVAKAIGVGLVPSGGQGPGRLAFTRLLSSDDVDRCLESLEAAPILLQLFEPKVADVRVTVVGERVFATRIDAPASAGIDWRAADLDDLRHEPVALPAGLEHALVRLVQRYGLEFGAIDLLLRADGSFVFLELNPNGQWAWIEQEIGVPISAALVDLLAGG